MNANLTNIQIFDDMKFDLDLRSYGHLFPCFILYFVFSFAVDFSFGNINTYMISYMRTTG